MMRGFAKSALLSGCAQPLGGEADKQNMNADSRPRVALAAKRSGDRDLAISMHLAAAEQEGAGAGYQAVAFVPAKKPDRNFVGV